MLSVPEAQIEKAVAALKAFLAGEIKPKTESKKSSKGSLFDTEEDFNLIFTLRKVPEKDQTKPIRIPIPHSIYGRPGASVCLITKDPQTKWESFVDENPVRNLKEVVSLAKLRNDFKAFKHRRELLSRHNLFLCDAAVVPMLPPLLGSKFFAAKKHPFPVNLAPGEFRATIAAARDSTYVHIPRGTAVNVRIGHSDHSKAEIVANIVAALPLIAEVLPRKWRNIQAIHLKTTSSVALPLFNAAPTVEAHATTAEDIAIQEREAATAAAEAEAEGALKARLTIPEYRALLPTAEARGLTVAQLVLLRRARFALGEGKSAIGGMGEAKAKAVIERLTKLNPKYKKGNGDEADADTDAEDNDDEDEEDDDEDEDEEEEEEEEEDESAEEDEDEEEEEIVVPPPKKAAAKKAAPAPTPAPVAAVKAGKVAKRVAAPVSEDDEEEPAPKAKASKAAAPKAAAPKAAAGKGKARK